MDTRGKREIEDGIEERVEGGVGGGARLKAERGRAAKGRGETVQKCKSAYGRCKGGKVEDRVRSAEKLR